MTSEKKDASRFLKTYSTYRQEQIRRFVTLGESTGTSERDVTRFKKSYSFSRQHPLDMVPTRFALTINGAPYVQITDISVLNFERTNSFSMSAWARTSHNNFGVVMGKTNVFDTGGASGRGYDMYFFDTGHVGWNLNNNFVALGNYISIRTNTTFNDGNIHHIVVTYDGTSSTNGMRIYVDGVNQAVTVLRNALTATIQNNNNFALGIQSTQLGAAFIGNIDECIVYSKELSQTEVTALYNGGCPPYIPNLGISNLVAWWSIEPTYPIITDSSPSRNHGTLISGSAGNIRPIRYPGCR